MDFVEKLKSYLNASDEARRYIQETSNIKLTSFEIQIGLMDVLEIEDEIALLERDLTSSEIIELLQDIDFRKYRPEILTEIFFEGSIIPSGTERSLREALIRHNGERWIIYKNDSDTFPSNPHAHNYESGLKLHLGTGDLYLRRKRVNRISKKSLLSLREKVKNISLPELLI